MNGGNGLFVVWPDTAIPICVGDGNMSATFWRWLAWCCSFVQWPEYWCPNCLLSIHPAISRPCAKFAEFSSYVRRFINHEILVWSPKSLAYLASSLRASVYVWLATDTHTLLQRPSLSIHGHTPWVSRVDESVYSLENCEKWAVCNSESNTFSGQYRAFARFMGCHVTVVIYNDWSLIPSNCGCSLCFCSRHTNTLVSYIVYCMD